MSPLMHRRVNDAWADEVNPDPQRRQLRGHACGQADQTVFRRNVGSAGREAEERVNGPNVDDRPAVSARKHGWSLVLQTQKSALQVDVEDAVPFLLRQVHDACELPLDARVIHGVVEASKGLKRVGHHPFHVLSTETSVVTKLVCRANVNIEPISLTSFPFFLNV